MEVTDKTTEQDRKPNGNGKPDVNSWPTASSAAKILGVKPQYISTMVQREELHPQLDKNGIRRYDPSELESFQFVKEDQDQLTALGEQHTKTIQILTEALHRYLKIIPDWVVRASEQDDARSRRREERIELLEQRQAELLDSLGEFIRAQGERETAKLSEQRKQDRWDKALEALTTHAPDLVQDLMMGSQIRKLESRMDPEKLTALLEVEGMLSADEKEALEGLRDRMRAKQAKRKEAEEAKAKAKGEPPGKDDTDVATAGGAA